MKIRLKLQKEADAISLSSTTSDTKHINALGNDDDLDEPNK